MDCCWDILLSQQMFAAIKCIIDDNFFNKTVHRSVESIQYPTTAAQFNSQLPSSQLAP